MGPPGGGLSGLYSADINRGGKIPVTDRFPSARRVICNYMAVLSGKMIPSFGFLIAKKLDYRVSEPRATRICQHLKSEA